MPSRSPGTVRVCAPGCTSAHRAGSADDYLGVDVNVAARVADGASGGEFLVSGDALDELDRDRRLGPQEADVPRQGRAQRRQRLLAEGKTMSAQEPEILDEAAIADDETALERRGPVDLMQVPRLLGGALGDLRTIAEGMAMLPKLLLRSARSSDRVDSLDAEVKQMRAAVEEMGGDVGELNAASPGSSPTSRTSAALRTRCDGSASGRRRREPLAARAGRRRPAAGSGPRSRRRPAAQRSANRCSGSPDRRQPENQRRRGPEQRRRRGRRRDTWTPTATRPTDMIAAIASGASRSGGCGGGSRPRSQTRRSRDRSETTRPASGRRTGARRGARRTAVAGR